MDIKIERNDINFVYRVASLILSNGKILVQKSTKFDHVTLPGGKCAIGESSIEASIREFKEEVGADIKFVKVRAVIENFFDSKFDNKKRHEILIINEFVVLDDKYLNKNILENIENKDDNYEYYEWVLINELSNYDLKPIFLQEVINSSDLVYKVNYDK